MGILDKATELADKAAGAAGVDQTAPKKKLIAGLLGIFLGWIGIHQFYLGNKKLAVIHLAAAVGGIVLQFIPLIGFIGYLLFAASEVYGIAIGVLILIGKITKDADGNELVS